MKYRDPLKQILSQTRSHWDRDETRPAVRHAFGKALLCRTPALGAEIYASENQEKIVCHTCKGKGCPSCGHRATVTWQRERWAALPDVSYKGITFTMPDVLWQIFCNNPALARVLPVLAANVIQAYASARHGLQVGVISILHTFKWAVGVQLSCSYDDYVRWTAIVWQMDVSGLLRRRLDNGILAAGGDQVAARGVAHWSASCSPDDGSDRGSAQRAG
jgi:hypothetical protein